MSGGPGDILKLDLYEILGVKEDATEKEVGIYRFRNIELLIILWMQFNFMYNTEENLLQVDIQDRISSLKFLFIAIQ